MSYTNLRLQGSYVIDDIKMIYVLLQTLSKTSPLVKKLFINKVQWKHIRLFMNAAQYHRKIMYKIHSKLNILKKKLKLTQHTDWYEFEITPD